MQTVIKTENDHSDNKAMVASLPSVGNPPQASVRLNITDPEKNHPAQTQTTRIRFRNRIRLPYVFNLLVSVIVFAMTVLLEFGYIPPSKSGFYCNDPALSHKYTGETIGATTLMVGNLFAVPFLVLFLSEFVRKGSVSRICLREVWYFYKEFLTGFALVLLITEVAKALIGEHRPHFFDICQPDAAQNCTHGQYIEQFRCTVTKYSNYFIVDTSRSFPSGHSSLSFFVAVYLSELCELAKKLKNKLSSGLDEIPTSLVKLVVPILKDVLCYIFNNVFKEGVFPNQLKIPIVKSLHKKGDSNLMVNYKPISLLPSFSKLLEQCAKDFLNVYSSVSCWVNISMHTCQTYQRSPPSSSATKKFLNFLSELS